MLHEDSHSLPQLDALADGAVTVQTDERPTILVTTVDIGGGKSERIEIRKGDDPAHCARLFCDLHRLPPAVLGPLTQHLLDNLRKASTKPAAAAPTALTKAAPAAPAMSPSLPASSSPEEPLAPPIDVVDSPLHVPGRRQQQQQQLGSSDSAFPSLSPTPSPQPALSALHSDLSPQRQPEFGAAAQEHSYPAHHLPAHHLPARQQQQQQQQASSFSNPDDWLMQQLSNKLVPVDSKMLTVSSEGSKGSQHKRNARRGSHSADPSPRDSVHFRLYNKAVDQQKRAEAKRQLQTVEVSASLNASKTRMSWISAEMMRERTHGPFDNYGEMLYAEGLESAAQRRSKADAVKAEQSARELDGATFHPEISALARALCGGGDVESAPAWQRLSKQKRTKTLERLQEMKQMREKAEVQECTFKPEIDSRSRAIMSQRGEMLRSLHMSAHEQLFQDAIRRQQKMEELASWVPEEATFQPQVNKNSTSQHYLRRSYDTSQTPSPSLGGARAGAGADEAGGAEDPQVPQVVHRLYACHAKTQAKLEAARARFCGPTDPATGRPLYRPEVGRAPRNALRSSGSDQQTVYDQLYAKALELQSKKAAAEEAEQRQALADACAAHALDTSARMYARLKAKRFAQIFDYLDTERGGSLDLVGLVRHPTSRVDDLDPEVREDVELAAEVHAHAAGLPEGEGEEGEGEGELPAAPAVGRAEFEALMEQSLRLRRGPRSYLVPSPSAKAQLPPSFQPTINARSREMAARLRPPEADTYQLLHGTADTVRSKLEAVRRANEDNELRECTFVPLLNANSLAAEGRALRAAWQAYSATADSEASTPRSGPGAAGTPRSGGAGPAAARPASASVATRSSNPNPNRSPANRKPQAQAAGAGAGAGSESAADVDKLLALEQEVRAALQGVSLTAEHGLQ